MKKRWIIALAIVCCLTGCFGIAAGEILMTAEPKETAVGGLVDVKTETGDADAKVKYTLSRGGNEVFQGKEDSHFEVSFRPREEGEYLLETEVIYPDGSTDKGSVRILVSGTAEDPQNTDKIYSQKDGWWKDKAYSKSELEKSGCAIFTLSHALLRMGWTGEAIRPENLAVTYKNCYVKNGTAVARLIHNASLEYGYTTRSALVTDAASLREGLKNGDYYSFSIAAGHIALMTGIDEKAGKVRIVDSAPSATFERIKKGKIYDLRDGEYIEVEDPGEIAEARYFFETQFYGGMEYYMDLSYCARRGGRLIRPAWCYYMGDGGRIGAVVEALGSGESVITVNDEKKTVVTRELSWGEEGQPRLAVVNGNKAIRMVNSEGKRIGNIPAHSVVPVLGENEDQVYVLYGENRGYAAKRSVEVIEPIEGEIWHGVISVNGNTSGRATVKLRHGPSEKERVAGNWKTGTEVTVIRKENDFWLVEAGGIQVWVQENYVTTDAPAESAGDAEKTENSEVPDENDRGKEAADDAEGEEEY